MMDDNDLVDVIWAGPFHADQGQVGSVIKVTRAQAKANPAWFQPIGRSRAAANTDETPGDLG